MKTPSFILLLALAALANPSFAGKPEWASKGNKHQQAEQVEQSQVEIQIGAYFGERQRLEVSNYYETQGRAGKCPPGLAKKHNGCQPPGQAKRWQMGRPLGRDEVFYPVPDAVAVRIGLPPTGYRYVRVLNDVLLIAIGTNLVVDAIQDLMH
jgi:Ni/Co efflux regulator RcnB